MTKQVSIQTYLDSDPALNKLVNHHKKILEKKIKEVEERVQSEEISKKEAVQEVGKYLEKSKTVKKDEISSTITRIFDGYINRGWIQSCCPDKWKRSGGYIETGDYKNRFTMEQQQESEASSTENHVQTTSFGDSSVTTEEQQRQMQEASDYDRFADHDKKLLDTMHELIYRLTGMTETDIGELLVQSSKNLDREKLIVEASEKHMIQVLKRQGRYSLNNFNVAHRLGRLLDKFTDLLDKEQDIKNKEQYGR